MTDAANSFSVARFYQEIISYSEDDEEVGTSFDIMLEMCVCVCVCVCLFKWIYMIESGIIYHFRYPISTPRAISRHFKVNFIGRYTKKERFHPSPSPSAQVDDYHFLSLSLSHTHFISHLLHLSCSHSSLSLHTGLEIQVRLYNLRQEAKKKGFHWLLGENNEMVKSAVK